MMVDLPLLLERFGRHLIDFDFSIALLSYLMIPVGAYVAFKQQSHREDLGVGVGAFLKYCFAQNSEKLPYHSMRLDIGFVIVKKFFNAWFLAPLLLSSAVMANFCYSAMVGYFGERPQLVPSLALTAAMIAVCVLVQDFVQFMVHYVHHKVKLLWAVHKVHHSSEFLLLSFSVKRTHILEEAVNLTLTSAFLGVLIGVMSYAFSLSIWQSEIYGVDAWFMLHLFSFWHLRHSHMALSYGWLENILQSPAQHQLHHSLERAHWDKNFGLLLSVWDRMFGCFLRSADPRSFRVGLPVADRGDYDSVWKLYVTPFRKIYQAAARPAAEPAAAAPAIAAPAMKPYLSGATPAL